MFVVFKETGISGNTGTTTFKGHENLAQNCLPSNCTGWSYLADGSIAKNVLHLNNGLGICQEGPFVNTINAADYITGVNKIYAFNTNLPNGVVATVPHTASSFSNTIHSGLPADQFGNIASGYSAHKSLTCKLIDNDQSYCIECFCPEFDAKNCEVTLTPNGLRVRVNSGKTGSYDDGFYTIPTPCDVDCDKITAHSSKGYMKITLPRSKKALESIKKIKVD